MYWDINYFTGILGSAYEYESCKKTNFFQYIQKQPTEVFYVNLFLKILQYSQENKRVKVSF